MSTTPRRILLSLTVGLTLALMISWVDLPLRGSIYQMMIRLRGPIQPAKNIALLITADQNSAKEVSLHTRTWLSDVRTVLHALQSKPPNVVYFDFEISPDEKRFLGLKDLNFPTYSRELDFTKEGDVFLLPFVRSPEFLPQKNASQSMSPDPFMLGTEPSQLLRSIAPQELTYLLNHGPQVLNITGPSGTYPRIPLSATQSDPKRLQQLADKIVLIAPPLEETRSRLGQLPFYPKTGIAGWDETEVVANIIDTVIHKRGIRQAPEEVSFLITALVAASSVWVLFSTPPLMGILSVVLISFLLVVTALLAIHMFFFLDILPPFLAIVFAYYFLIPYRLIVEYKGRWRYQQENRLLAEVETLKNNFMSLVTHNLKTPIARIEGIVETLLASKGSTEEEWKNGLSRLLHSTEDLNRLVTRILNLARVERPEYQLQVTNRDLNQIVEKVIENHEPLAQEKDITLHVDLEPLFPINMEPELIQESIANLVENGIKYTPTGGEVLIKTEEVGEHIHFSVSDTGPGIPEEEESKIFSKFYRGAEVKNKGIRGSGLGLYLVKYFIELHGGSIQFENRPEGGSRFTLSLLRKK